MQTAVAIPDMYCSSCVAKVEQALATVPALDGWRVNAARQQVFVEHDPVCDPLLIMRALEHVGFHPVLAADGRHNAADRALLKRLGVAALGAAQVMFAALALYFAGDAMQPEIMQLLRWTSLLFTTAVVGYSATPFLVGAAQALLRRTVTMDVPVALAITVAFAASVHAVLAGGGDIYFDSVVMFTFLLLLARFVDARLRAQLHARPAAALVPSRAERFDGVRLVEVPVTALRAGDVVWVRPGDRLPADGTVDRGEALVDESLLTGESHAVSRNVGQVVYAGALALAAFAVSVTHARDTRVNRLDALAEQVRAVRAPSVVSADRVARVFVPVILLLAAATWLGWRWLDPAGALPALLAVLVVSCPCALSLAAPAAFSAALANLQRRGAVVRDGSVIERLAGVTHAVVDKTGTLTVGAPVIKTTACLADVPASRCLAYASALERHSRHPVAGAFTAPTAYHAQRVTVERQGVRGEIDGHNVAIGSGEFVGGQVDDAIHLVIDGVAAARFTLADQFRPDAAAGLSRLGASGVGVSILSGDNKTACARAAAALGVPFRAAASPEDKLAAMRSRQDAGEVVLAVGDGFNDVPMLAAVDVSVAVLEAPDRVREQADIVVATSSMAVVAALVTCARRTVAVMRQNLTWAFAYNLVAIPAAALGWLPPWAAALGMSLSSLGVTANAARLARGG